LVLLFQQCVELCAGQRDDLHQVVERLHGERLAVGDDPIGRVGKVGAHASRVHQRDLRAAALAGGLQLGVGDQIAQGRLPGGCRAPGDVGGDGADLPVLDLGDPLLPGLHELDDLRVGSDVAGDDVIVGDHRGAHHVLRPPVDLEVDPGEHTAEGGSLGDVPRLTGGVGRLADVGLVRVPHDDQVDVGGDAPGDPHTGPGDHRTGVGALADVDLVALVHQHDLRLDT